MNNFAFIDVGHVLLSNVFDIKEFFYYYNKYWQHEIKQMS